MKQRAPFAYGPRPAPALAVLHDHGVEVAVEGGVPWEPPGEPGRYVLVGRAYDGLPAQACEEASCVRVDDEDRSGGRVEEDAVRGLGPDARYGSIGDPSGEDMTKCSGASWPW